MAAAFEGSEAVPDAAVSFGVGVAVGVSSGVGVSVGVRVAVTVTAGVEAGFFVGSFVASATDFTDSAVGVFWILGAVIIHPKNRMTGIATGIHFFNTIPLCCNSCHTIGSSDTPKSVVRSANKNAPSAKLPRPTSTSSG